MTSVDVVTDANGQANVVSLVRSCGETGVFSIKVTEIEAPSGYTLDSSPQFGPTKSFGTAASPIVVNQSGVLTFVNQNSKAPVAPVVVSSVETVVKATGVHK